MLALPLAACSGDDSPASSGASQTATVRPASVSAPVIAHSPPAATDGDTVTGAPATEAPPTATATPVAGGIGLLTIVDKERGLPAAYGPLDLAAVPEEWVAPGFGGLALRAEAADALSQMLAAAREAGYEVRVRSAYRSYAEQQATFQYWVDTLGEAEARRVSAEPGHSEHQLGLAADLTSATVGYDLSEAFGQTAEGQWLAAQSYSFGFALSYPAGQEDVTGYAYEPWHFRYIGREAAQAWRDSGLTLGEWLLLDVGG